MWWGLIQLQAMVGLHASRDQQLVLKVSGGAHPGCDGIDLLLYLLICKFTADEQHHLPGLRAAWSCLVPCIGPVNYQIFEEASVHG